MINSPIFKTNLENISGDDLRYLFYLSRHDAWVEVAGDFFQFKIHSYVKTIEIPGAKGTTFEHQLVAISEADETNLKLELSKNVQYVNVFGISSKTLGLMCTHKTLPDMNLDVIHSGFDRLSLKMKGQQRINVYAEAHNFDFKFLSDLGTTSYFPPYQETRDKVKKEALMNALWLAAKSGDSQQLQILLANAPDCDINELYKNKSILHAMFEADPLVDLPFKNEASDYKSCIELLIKHGLDPDRTSDLYTHYQQKQHNLRFYQQRNPHQMELLSIINNKINCIEEDPLKVDEEQFNFCVLV